MKKIILLITISSIIFLQSCGRKGPLHLPSNEQVQDEQIEQNSDE